MTAPRLALQPRPRRPTGFSLFELLAALGVLALFIGPVLLLFAQLQKTYAGTQGRIQSQAAARSALSLMAEEIELAGSNPTVDTTTAAAVGPCATPCAISFASGAGLNDGDVIALDIGSNFEQIPVAVSNGSYTATPIKAHAVGSIVVYPGYPYATGVCPANSSGVSGCSANKLQFFGNIYGDNKLYFVEYVYDAANQRITRSVTALTATSKSPAYSICDNVLAASFNVARDAQGNDSSITLQITVQTPYLDPETRQFATFSLQRGVIQARNVAIASQMAAAANSSNIAPTPAAISNFVP
ncbi:MAG: hypothetical protein ACYC6M_14280 [Terriglobales bacterium]